MFRDLPGNDGRKHIRMTGPFRKAAAYYERYIPVPDPLSGNIWWRADTL
jgi:hypothetical protein